MLLLKATDVITMDYFTPKHGAPKRLMHLVVPSARLPYLELRAIAYACTTFGKTWRGARILCHSDCEGAVAALNARRAYTPDMQSLLRIIGSIAIHYDFDIRAQHIPGLSNVRADPLSRLDLTSFLLQVSHGKELQQVHPVPLPSNTSNLLS